MAGLLSGPIPSQLVGGNEGAADSGHNQCACAPAQSFIFLGQATQPANILEYRYPLGVDGGVATAKLLLPKIIIFGIPQSRDFRRSNFAVAKPPYQQQAKTRRWEKRDLAKLYTYTLSWSSIYLEQYKTMENRETTKRTALHLLKR